MVVGEQLKYLINKKNLFLWIVIGFLVYLILICIFKEVKKKICWFYFVIDLLVEYVFDEKFYVLQLYIYKYMLQCFYIFFILQ